ncbi:MAG TPA: LysR family transcriptional regulator [Burkholderiaceae bacterium]|nr:LysR family transcriptional regulator [Burkholderiaceae bacterium]
MQLTHRQIEVFRAVMATGQVTRAAMLLHTSQPTVSRELARLEQVLKMTLFERVRGRLQPTARALALHEEVERSFVGLERIAATAQALRQFAHARLTVACLPALAHALLPQATRLFLAAHGEAQVSVTPHESPLLEQALTEQRFDLGLSERREAPPATARRLLLRADEVAVLPGGHPLAGKRVLRPRDFAGLPFISLAPTDPYRQQVDAIFEQQGVQRQMTVETGSAVSVCEMVRQGVGVAIVNPLTALAMSGDELVIRPISEPIPFEVALVVPQLRSASPLREAFERSLVQAAAALVKRLHRPL